MEMNRYEHALTLARRINAARARLHAAKDDELKPDEYRQKHGRCPDGYEYDPLSDSCEPKEGADDAPADEPEKKGKKSKKGKKGKKKGDKKAPKGPPPSRPPSPKTPGDWLDGRKERGDYLEKLFHDDPELYQQEADRMRESGELPDRETAEMLVKIKDVEDLPPEVLKDKEELAKIVAQQENQRRIEEMVLEGAEQELRDLEKQRQRAVKTGKQPPKIEPFKFLQDLEQKYNRNLLGESEEIEQILDDEADEFAKIVSDSATKPGEPAYWWKKWWEKVTKPIPTWTPFEGDVLKGLEKMVGGSVEAKTLTSPDVTGMEPREIGFPPYDRDRQPRKHIPDEPSGRPAFPPYEPVETVEYRDRDARMQGFPPYDGKGEPHDSETVGLPPYNRKKPHKGRGFPPYHDGESVYEHRRRTVDLAVK
jgi:hypothetical protein